jgi:hypothetical protein
LSHIACRCSVSLSGCMSEELLPLLLLLVVTIRTARASISIPHSALAVFSVLRVIANINSEYFRIHCHKLDLCNVEYERLPKIQVLFMSRLLGLSNPGILISG